VTGMAIAQNGNPTVSFAINHCTGPDPFKSDIFQAVYMSFFSLAIVCPCSTSGQMTITISGSQRSMLMMMP